MDFAKEQAAEGFNYQSNIANFDELTPQSIEAASQRLSDIGAADQTGVLHDKYFSEELKTNVYMIMENIQQTGSFKIRGASNMLIKAFNQAKEQGR